MPPFAAVGRAHQRNIRIIEAETLDPLRLQDGKRLDRLSGGAGKRYARRISQRVKQPARCIDDSRVDAMAVLDDAATIGDDEILTRGHVSLHSCRTPAVICTAGQAWIVDRCQARSKPPRSSPCSAASM